MSKTKPRLVIIDGNALIHRSFHALPPTMRTKSGQIVNAVYGFTSFFLKALNEFQPEYVVLTLDKKDPTFRHKAYADYKAHRAKAPDELYEQIPLVKKVAAAFGVPIFELSGFEADDLIGTICAQTDNKKNLEKIIITGDLDTLQLVGPKTKVYTMSRGLSDSVLYGAEQVQERYGLRPDQMIDYKALRGDPSDNIPGVKGIGEKTAGELIGTFKNLDGVLEAAKKNHAKIKPRIIGLLKEYREAAYLSRDLVTINCQAPLKFSLEDAKFASFRLEKVLTIFSELEFKSLLVKVKEIRDKLNKTHNKTLAGDNDEKTDTSETSGDSGTIKFARNAADFDYQLIDDDKKFAVFLKKLKTATAFAIDTETSGPDPITARLLGISFSWKNGQAYFVLANDRRLAALKPILENDKIKKYGHNLKFDWRVLKNQGLELAGLEFDTMIASYLLNPGNRQHDLDSLAFTELGYEKISKTDLANTQPTQLTLNFSALDPKKLSLYSCEDADFTQRLSKILKEKIITGQLNDVLDKIEMPLIPVLGEMENNGIKMEIAPLKKLDKEVSDQLAKLEKTIHRLAKSQFNINSTKQLKEVLFEKLAIPTDNIKKNKTGFSTAEDELIKLRDLHPIIPLIQDYRELNKLQTTYLNGLPPMISPKTGRIHTSFNQTITATGRLSSAEPNLQNIPTRTEEGRRIRAAFVAAPDYRLIGFDYSQIELRLAAHMSGDKKMIAAFVSGKDIHAATAAEINDVTLEEVTKSMRREAKAINFGIIYGQGPHGLSQNAGISYARASEFIKKYFLAYPGVKKMMDNSIAVAQDQGYAVTLFGRKRPLPEMNSAIPAVRKSAERMAINTPLQGTAADLIKLAMIKIAALIKNRENDIRLLLQVHDELIFEIKKDKLDTYAPKIRAIMQEVLKLRVPIVVDESVGDNWGELK
ncbi:TPA: DNA polymerase I [Candidatus Falkowbacteria bacterium]|nr:MAG: polymerase I protein [Candidatus Falkowbacteria bacterium GW2011_GWF2_43_32]HBA36805.1 DNA polymerase I [Candidatus Falkowbacteria bacterium]